MKPFSLPPTGFKPGAFPIFWVWATPPPVSCRVGAGLTVCRVIVTTDWGGAVRFLFAPPPLGAEAAVAGLLTTLELRFPPTHRCFGPAGQRVDQYSILWRQVPMQRHTAQTMETPRKNIAGQLQVALAQIVFMITPSPDHFRGEPAS